MAENAKAEPKHQAAIGADADKRADERRAAAFKADEKLRADEYKANEERIAAARKHAEARRKEDARRAALSPAERAAEDDKRAAMTPDERAKDDETKGLVAEQQDQINLLVGTPQFPVQTETSHPAEFILSEADGHGSRDVGTIADPGSVKIGQTLKIATQATLTAPAVFAPNVTTDTACDGIAIYGVTTNGANANIAVLTRNAEVNANLLYYPVTITGADKLAIARALAAHNIIVRS
jgi:hypothetical protein